MARLGPGRVGFALVLFLATNAVNHAGADDKCRSGCGGVTPHNFKFVDGTTYQYNYEGTINVQLSSSQGQHSETKVKATVLLTQQPQCNQVLRLQNLQIQGDSKRFGNIADVEKPIKLNYHDGHVEDVICTEAGDTQNSLNIKRAIASMFQAALNHHNTEIDVFGSCPTEFATHKEGNVFVIKKVRNLNKCAFRESIKQDFMATSFDLHSEIKTSPFLQGQYSAELKIKGGILDQVTVHEDYIFVPFSLGSDGAKAKVTSKLSYVKSSRENPKVTCSVPKSIIFEDPHPLVADKSISKALSQAIKDTANGIDATVKDSTANKFSKIVQLLRHAKKTEIIAIYGQVRGGAGFNNQETARRVFLDALFRAGTGDAIEAALEIYKNNELSALEGKLLFLGMTFVRHATPSSLKTATELLGADVPREVYLGIGALAGKYCRQHSCSNVPELNALLNKLTEKLSKPKTRANENTVLAALKAIQNIGEVNSAAAGKIVELAQDKQGANRVRSAALDAYLADPCSDKFRDSALSILNDVQQDSEIRIKAYLAAAECPNGKVASSVKALLGKELSYQVGGFIVSHLKTLRSSTNPDKAHAKSQLGEIYTTHNFPIDPTKFSLNHEFSHTFNTFGLGGSVESNIIYSPKSFVPRSTSLNLTTEIFGHTFNFLEIDTRQENLDKLLEHYFGPLGVLRKESPNNMFAKGKDGILKLTEHLKQRIGKHISKREISKSQIETFGKQFNIKENELNKDLDLDLSIKLFGSEALFLSLNDDIKQYTPDVLIDKLFDFLDGKLQKAKKFDETINSNLLFLDSEVSYPTSLGFPLRLELEGASSVQLKASGSLDIGKLLSKNTDGEYKLSLIPSGNLQITARLAIDAAVVQRGLKVSAKYFTATGGSLDLILSPKTVDLKYSIPVDKQEVFTATHEIIFESREPSGHETEVALKQTQSKDVTVCLDHLSPLIGLTFCAHVNQPNIAENKGTPLPYPLNGNSKFSLTIDKNDLGYVRYKRVAFDTEKLGLELLVEVIGNQNNVKSSIKTELFARPNQYLMITFKSPIKNAALEARIVNTNAEFSGFAKFTMDDFEYYGKVGVAISGSAQRAIYKPLLEYKAGQGNIQQSPYRLDGQIIVEFNNANTKYTLDNVKVIGFPTPISITGTLGRSPTEVSADVTVSDGQKSGSFNGKLLFDGATLGVSAMFKNTINPQINFNLIYQLAKTIDQIDSSLQFQHGNLQAKDNIFKLKNRLKFKRHDKHFELDTKNEMSYPALGIQNKFDLEVTDKSLSYDLEIAYKQIKIGSELEAKVDRKVHGDFNIEFELHALENKIEIDLRRDVDKNKSKLKNVIVVNGKSLELSGDVIHAFDTNKIEFGTDLLLKISGLQDIKIKSELKHNPNDLDTSLKVVSGSKTIVDAFLKSNREGSINGNLKVVIDGIVNAQGQVKANKLSGNADLLVDVVKIQRKIKTETTFNVNDPTYNFDVTLFTNFEKDNSRKYRLTTNNQLKLESVDSKNTLEILGQKTTANLKADHAGDLNNGKQSAEFDVTLPNDFYFVGKINREVKVENGVGNGNVFVNFEQRDNKNAPGRKFTLKGVGKGIDIENGIYDVTYNLALDDSNGKNLHGDLSGRGHRQGDKKHVEFDGKLYGSVLPEVLQASISSTYKKFNNDYKITTSYGKAATFDLKGKYDIHQLSEKKPSTSEILLEVHTPLSKLKVIKFKSDGSILIPETHEDQFEYKDNISIFVDDDGTDPAPTIDVQKSSDWKINIYKGTLKNTANCKRYGPVSVDVNYEREKDKKFHGNFLAKYSQGKTIHSEVTVTLPAPNQYTLDYTLETPDDRAKSIKIQSKGKLTPETKSVEAESSLTLNGDKYTLISEVGQSEHTPSLLLELRYPNGKEDKIQAKVNSVGQRSFSGQTSLAFHVPDFTFDGSLDVQAENIEDFDLKLSLDSPKLKLDKIQATANTKEAKGGNKLNFSLKSANQNLVSGNANIKTREEDAKFIVEGTGTFTVKNDKKSGRFKYSRNNLNKPSDKERGVEFSFQGSIGDKALDSEIKLTNLHLRYLLSYCEQKKECANIELDAKTTTNLDTFKNVIEANIDLRKLGWSHEFGLKSETKRDHLLLDHTVDIHFQNQKDKYQYSLYLHPTKSGVSLTTPKRIVSLESTHSHPKIGEQGPIKGEILFYLNKKTKPNDKTSFSYLIDPKQDVKMNSLNLEAKLTHPALRKPLLASYKATARHDVLQYEFQGVLDLIPNSEKKVSFSGNTVTTKNDKVFNFKQKFDLDVQPINYKLAQVGTLNIDSVSKVFEDTYSVTGFYDGQKVENVISVLASPTKASAKLVFQNIVLLESNANLQLSKEVQIVDSNFKIIGGDPLQSHLEVKNFNTLRFHLTKAATQNPKLQVSAALVPGQIADFRADLLQDGKKIDFVHASVKLDETDFLKSDYGIQTNNIKEHLTDRVKAASNRVAKEASNALAKSTEEAKNRWTKLADNAKQNKADLQPVLDYYKGEFDVLRKEVETDETLRKLSEALSNILNAILSFGTDMAKIFTDTFEKSIEIIKGYQQEFAQALQNDILPKFKETVDKLSGYFFHLFESFSELFFNVLGQISKFLDAHHAELRQIATVLTSTGQDIGRFVLKSYEQARTLITNEIQKIYEELKALPYYDQLKEVYKQITEGLPLPPDVVRQFQAIASEISGKVPIPEVKHFIDITAEYIVKKMKAEKVDDMSEIMAIIRAAAEAIKHLIMSIEKPDVGKHGENIPLPFSTRLAYTIPKIVAGQFSSLNRLIAGDLPTLEQLTYGFSLNPFAWIPPFRRYAIIAQGQHIFTFDGKHLTFPGKCNYLLARDLGGEFALVGTYTNGILTEISFYDKNDVITLKKTGVASLNGVASELPVRGKLTHAYRLYTQVQISSKTGVKLFCTPDLSVCVVRTSGFYHGKLRGLLGNANHEPFDDYTLPNGKIVQSESDFGNAYKMQTDCPAVKTVDHTSHHHEAECMKLFDEWSLLSPCFPIVKTDIFRQACDHGLAAKVPHTVEAIATAYSAACATRFVLAGVPKELVKCTNSDKEYELYDSFSVKSGQKAADIVIAIDVDKSNKAIYTDLISQVGAQLTKDLGERGIKDVEFHIITYGGDYADYPSHITTNGGKFTFKGKFPTLRFSEPEEEDDIEVGIKQVDFILSLLQSFEYDFNLAIGNTAQARAYVEAIQYPFRAHAAKAVIAVTSSPCESGSLLLLQKIRAVLLRTPSISLHVFTPMKGANFKVKDDKTTKNVIGFNRDGVLTFSDAKKHPTGRAELVKDLSYDDFCSEFTSRAGGNVFVTDTFKEANKNNKKTYVQVASYNIAETLTGYDQGLDCHCVRDTPYTAKNVCLIAYQQKKAPSNRKLVMRG